MQRPNPSSPCVLAAVLASAFAGAPVRAAADEGPTGVELVLRAHASAEGDRVTLGDLAELRRDEAGVGARLLSLDLGPAPRVGQPAHLDRAQLESWIRLREPRLASRLHWSGAASAELERASQQLPAAALDEAARQALGAWLASRSDRFEIEPQRSLEPVQLPLGRVATKVRPLSPVGLPASHMAVWVDVSVGGRFERAVALDYDVRAWREAWVAATELARGEDLDETRASRAEVDIAAAAQPLWTQPVAHARLRNPVHRGQALAALHVEERPPVVRGERVAVYSRQGDLSIETSAEALQDGRAGQDVLVRIATSSAPVMARVLKPGLVEIH